MLTKMIFKFLMMTTVILLCQRSDAAAVHVSDLITHPEEYHTPNLETRDTVGWTVDCTYAMKSKQFTDFDRLHLVNCAYFPNGGGPGIFWEKYMGVKDCLEKCTCNGSKMSCHGVQYCTDDAATEICHKLDRSESHLQLGGGDPNTVGAGCVCRPPGDGKAAMAVQ